MHLIDDRRITGRAAGRGVTLALLCAGIVASLSGAAIVGVAAQQPEPAEQAEVVDPRELASQGQALIQEARETADPTRLAGAQIVFDQLLTVDPGNVEAVIGLGTIALARHDFDLALELGEEARQLAPSTARPLGIVADALIELGRYDEAGEAIDLMLRARPDLASYTRLSYYHELHGRLDQAIDAMERAVIAGGPVPENTEYARVLLGDLWLRAGNVERAEMLYETALANLPGFVPALRGLGRTAAAAGDLAGAVARLEEAVAHVPLPDLLIAMGEVQEAAGDGDGAQATYRLVGDIEGFLRANGVAADPALAVFEADHGDAATALRLAREAYGDAPSIRAADALAWALHKDGQTDEARAYAEEALRTGMGEPTYLYHAGLIAASQGDADAARAWLAESLDGRFLLSPLHALEAVEALEALGAPGASEARAPGKSESTTLGARP